MIRAYTVCRISMIRVQVRVVNCVISILKLECLLLLLRGAPAQTRAGETHKQALHLLAWLIETRNWVERDKRYDTQHNTNTVLYCIECTTTIRGKMFKWYRPNVTSHSRMSVQLLMLTYLLIKGTWHSFCSWVFTPFLARWILANKMGATPL